MPFEVLAATAVTAIVMGTATQMQAQKQQAKSAEAMYRYNAEVMQREASQIKRAGLEEQRTHREDMRHLLKRQRALYAKAGVRMEGTPMEVQLETISVMSEDIARLSEAYDIEAERAVSAAGLETYKARAVRRAGRLAVGTTLFGGVSDIATLGMKYQLQRG